MIFDKKTECETCINERCDSRGTRNVHFDGKKNHCSRYVTTESETRGRKLIEEIKESFRKNPIRLFMEKAQNWRK